MGGDAGTRQLNLTDDPAPEQSIDPSAPDEDDSSLTEQSAEESQDGLLLDDTVLDDTVSDETVSDDTVSDDTVSDETVSDGPVLDDTVSDGLVSDGPVGAVDERRPTRIGRGWAIGVAAVLVVLAAATGVGGYLAMKSHRENEAVATAEAAAVQAAKDCVTATQAPDTSAMAASQTKIIECATGDFGAQATLYSGILLDAYQAANAKVAVSEMRAAVEKHYDDGAMDVLVAVRVKVTNSQVADQEQGYRLRVRMAPADGTYKVDKLDQVAS
jgi:Mce-associated membrane protein